MFSDDQKSIDEADIVVFDLPFMRDFFCQRIIKPEGQIWAAWCLECEKNYPWITGDDLPIDLWMTYRQNADIVLPYFDGTYKDKLLTPLEQKRENVCMFISSPVNESKRLDYLSELMRHLPLDSYGAWQNNRKMTEDYGYVSKLRLMRQYRFTIAFENAVGIDYVTEKFFDPLIAGSVPIYLGASNIQEYTPGEHAMIDVRNYSSPQELAESVLHYCGDEKSYNDFFTWKTRPLNGFLLNMIEAQKVHPFIRLVDLAEKVRRGEYRSIFRF